MDYRKLLEDGYAFIGDGLSRDAYLSEHIFNFTTYDDDISEEFGRMAVAVAKAISTGTTFEFIKHEDNYRWFIVMVNMPFFSERISWGTSVRGAWWDLGYENGWARDKFVFQSCGLFDGEEQVDTLRLTLEEWGKFIDAIVGFSEAIDNPQ